MDLLKDFDIMNQAAVNASVFNTEASTVAHCAFINLLQFLFGISSNKLSIRVAKNGFVYILN